MKEFLVAVLVMMLGAGCASAFEVTFTEYEESCELVALIGHSYASAHNDASSFMGGKHLNLHHSIANDDYCVLNAAEGGAMAWDYLFMGTNVIVHGYDYQATWIEQHGSWLGVDQVDYVVITPMNDCWASTDPNFPCDDIEVQNYVDEGVKTALRFSHKLPVFVLLYPYAYSLRLAEGFGFYGLQAIDPAGYENLRMKWEAGFVDLPNIYLVDAFVKYPVAPDGIHFVDHKKAAQRIRKAFKEAR